MIERLANTMDTANPTVTVEITDASGTPVRTLVLFILHAVIDCGDRDLLPGVVSETDDFDDETIAYGINEGGAAGGSIEDYNNTTILRWKITAFGDEAV